MKIKFKFTLIITITLILFAASLNISVRKILKNNMENSITTSLKEVMKSTRESIKYTLSQKSYSTNSNGLAQDSNYLIEYLSLNYDIKLQIGDTEGNILSSNLKESNSEFIDNLSEIQAGKTIVNIKYNKNYVTCMLSYPIIINESFIGIINLTKDYSLIYLEYRNLINLLTYIEIALIIIIFLISYMLINKIVKPITSLTIASKKVGEGNYDVNISYKGNDEISILSKEFINMKTKIQTQILDIENEKEKVEKLALSRKFFFDTVAHELKTPLTSIIGYSEMIIDNVVNDEAFKNRAINRIYSESERLNNLVLELINISKGLSYIDEDLVEIDMSSIITQTCLDMSIKAQKYNLKISYILENGLILGKINKIKEVLINILDNAIKYSNKSSTIIVNSYYIDNFYVIDIINSSKRIPNEIYKHIFEPFVKSDTPNSEYSTGLGLYLCNEIISNHNGIITLDNGEEIITTIKLPFINK
ncbi:HAMP domain-containing sensor histidine kinase [Clostridium carnis]